MPISLDQDQDFSSRQITFGLTPELLDFKSICIENANKFRSDIRKKMTAFCQVTGDVLNLILNLYMWLLLVRKFLLIKHLLMIFRLFQHKCDMEFLQFNALNNRSRIGRVVDAIV